MGDQSIQIEYNQSLEPLERLLSGVKRAGDFFVSGKLEIPLPKVDVEGVGVLSFPVPATQISALIRAATRAPYGRGEATILDESVRKVWQLPPDKVQLAGKSWAANLEGILSQVVSGLGCDVATVTAELYKMLIYDEGGFFLAHRDTEKTNGMFGTLVVGLPSAHRGGELVIRHAGREVTVNLSEAEFSEVSFAAFYADCEHEVRPITEGNRVCLVYNLIQKQGKTARSRPMQAPDYEKQIAAAAELLKENLSAPGAPTKLAWLLEHQYSPDGLGFAALKSADAARVKVLAQAAEHAECAVHLGIVHIEESGSAQEQYQGYHQRGRGWYHDSDDEAEGAASDDFEIIEVCDWRHYVDQWRDRRDQPVQFGAIPLEPGELLPAGALDDAKPDQQRLMEASGNEGASFERSYHRAALVIWRRERYPEVLLQAGVDATLPYLKELIEAVDAKGAPPAARNGAVALARLIVNTWKKTPEYPGFQQSRRPEKRDGMLRLLNRLGDVSLVKEFVSEAVTRDYDGTDNAALAASARLMNAQEAGRLFSELLRRHMGHLHGHCVDLLAALTRKSKAGMKPEWRDAWHQVAGAAVGQLDEVGKKKTENAWMDWQASQTARVVDAGLVAKLLDVLSNLDAPALRAIVANKFKLRPEVFDPVTILVPALALAWEQNDEAVAGLWEHCTEFLLLRSGEPPASPTDWRQEAKLSCTCVDCRELQTFTLDPVAQTYRFRVRQDRRQHLHQQIEDHGLEMTHVTDRKGSPQTLVCTKDRRGYQRRCEQYRKDIAALTVLAEHAQKNFKENAGSLKRIKAACSLAAKWLPDSGPAPATHPSRGNP